jgi:hypothetical protein
MSDLLTDSGRCAASIQVLARLIGCNRDQIRLWRREPTAPAPEDLDLRAWHAWLEQTRRWNFAASLGKALDLDPEAIQAAAEQAPPAPSSVETKEQADLRFARLRADRMQRELDELDGRLVERVVLERVVSRLSALVVDRLTRGIWSELLPALDAATPDTRRACREAHDRAILAMRSDLGSAAVRQVLAEAMPKKD